MWHAICIRKKKADDTFLGKSKEEGIFPKENARLYLTFFDIKSMLNRGAECCRGNPAERRRIWQER